MFCNLYYKDIYICYNKTLKMETTQTIRTELERLFEGGKLYYYENRCWYTCFMAWKKLKKKFKEELIMVEGKADNQLHYWLQNKKTGEVYELHYSLMESSPYGISWRESEYTYKNERELNLFNWEKTAEESQKYAHNMKTRQSRFVWVWSIEEKN